MQDFRPYIAALAEGEPLAREEARAAFALILEGAATPAQLGAFLMGLRMRGETVEEIIGAAQAMRAVMSAVEAPPGAIDIVGTGGDGAGTYNISTLAAIIAAAAGAVVAKHGGKASSSRSGASDVLGELGVKVGIAPAAATECLHRAGLCFMAGPTHHPALRHAGPVRAELGVRTIFNLLGPLCNPARVERQALGVYSRDWLEPLARVLRELGSRRVWLLHGCDGLDEATTTGVTHVVSLTDGDIRAFDITPEDAGLPRASAQALVGGDPAHNARALRAVLAGEKNAYRDIAVLNAAIALVVAERAADLREGAALAATALDSGAAAATLEALVKHSNA
ncbi:anthranilate phosphoribosyltransferase [Methylocystis sp. IM3]|jgi:anthranilate phosphoribosyltransferase|uniref:anthranilate phosphoribosyltransferase n=1 Tax=unclassified Methylocystis TaxID=2625913 RepID=UPI000FA249A4|nr:MAG: anthranilate phosphoribosyltransferase [Hyphomicrobiales bacterium]